MAGGCVGAVRKIPLEYPSHSDNYWILLEGGQTKHSQCGQIQKFGSGLAVLANQLITSFVLVDMVYRCSVNSLYYFWKWRRAKRCYINRCSEFLMWIPALSGNIWPRITMARCQKRSPSWLGSSKRTQGWFQPDVENLQPVLCFFCPTSHMMTYHREGYWDGF